MLLLTDAAYWKHRPITTCHLEEMHLWTVCNGGMTRSWGRGFCLKGLAIWLTFVGHGLWWKLWVVGVGKSRRYQKNPSKIFKNINKTKGNIDMSRKHLIDYGTQTSDTPQWATSLTTALPIQHCRLKSSFVPSLKKITVRASLSTFVLVAIFPSALLLLLTFFSK